MHDDQFEAVRQRVVLRLALRLTFFINLIFGLLITAALAQSLSEGNGDLIGAAFFVFLWLTGLFFHGAFAFPLASRFIDRATRREIARDAINEKPKRHRLELDDDGELVEIVGEDEEKVKRKA